MAWKILLLVFLFLPASWTRVSRLNDAIDAASQRYAETKYVESIKAHRLLLDEFQLASPGLDFDLGLSYQYGEQPEEALSFYDKAGQASDKILASFAYNQSGVLIGNKKEYQAALSKFQTALIKDPKNAVARHNYELLARWMKRDEERKQQEENKPEPSEFAKQKKAAADRLVEQFKFKEALTLMEGALAQDPTVAAYAEFVQTLKDVVEIDEN